MTKSSANEGQAGKEKSSKSVMLKQIHGAD